MKTRSSLLRLLAAAGGVAGLAGIASAQPTLIHISGATLLENFVQSRAVSNDYIDVDGNNVALAPFFNGNLQQLAPYELPGATGGAATWTPATYWGILQSVSGSGNGFQELVNVGRTFSTTNSQTQSGCVTVFAYDPDGAGPLAIGSPVASQATTDLHVAFRTRAYFNRYRFINAGGLDNAGGDGAPVASSPLLNDANPAGFPFRADLTGWTSSLATSNASYRAIFTAGGNTTGSRTNFTTTTFPCTTSGMTNRLALRGEAAPAGTPSTGGIDGIPGGTIGGMTVDIAILDVPTTYFATIAGSPAVNGTPLASGYGNNGAIARELSGALTATNSSFTNGGGNKLTALGTAVLSSTAPGVYPSPNDGTDNQNIVFDTSILFAPISPVVNFGTLNSASDSNIRISELQHLYGTGRLPTGENLIVVTRDSGSGTRNGFQNSIGQDPSWGVGDNVGTRNNTDAQSRPGTTFLPSNKGSNDRVEFALGNTRLGVGYVGPERGVAGGGASGGLAGWLSNGQLAIPSVIADTYGGTAESRPTLANLLGNTLSTNPNAWVIGGPAVLSTFGDPTSAPAAKGGLGWQGQETRPASLNPRMRNPEAAAFINNINRSIRNFINLPGGDETVFSPGEWAATRFILIAGQDRVQDGTNPTNLLVNPNFSASLRGWYEGGLGQSVYKSADFAGFASNVAPTKPLNNRAGKVPTRNNPVTTYSDNLYNNGNGTQFVRGVNGSALTPASNLPIRNLVTGDFSGDGRRDINDAAELVRAEKARRTNDLTYTAPAIPGGSLLTGLASGSDTLSASDLSFEILGDFNADGSFNTSDVRYFADGLGIDATTGRLDRKAAFTAVDNAAVAAGDTLPYFPTTLASSKPYAAGDARGDIAKAARNSGTNAVGLQRFQNTRGYTPTSDGAVDTHDIYYVIANLFAANNGVALTSLTTGGPTATFATLGDAVKVDLSADINGDGIISIADLNEITTVVLGVPAGDLNFDGVVDAADRQIVQNGIASAPALITYSTGDLNGDGAVTAADLALLPAVCRADFDNSGTRDVSDIFAFLSAWFANAPNADFDNSGTRDVSDIFAFLSAWFAGC